MQAAFVNDAKQPAFCVIDFVDKNLNQQKNNLFSTG